MTADEKKEILHDFHNLEIRQASADAAASQLALDGNFSMHFKWVFISLDLITRKA